MKLLKQTVVYLRLATRDPKLLEAEYLDIGEVQPLITLQRLGTHLHTVILALMYQAKFSRYLALVVPEYSFLNSKLAFSLSPP